MYSRFGRDWASPTLHVYSLENTNIYIQPHVGPPLKGKPLSHLSRRYFPGVMSLTFWPVSPRAPPGSERPVCGTAPKTLLTTTGDSPVPPTHSNTHTHWENKSRGQWFYIYTHTYQYCCSGYRLWSLSCRPHRRKDQTNWFDKLYVDENTHCGSWHTLCPWGWNVVGQPWSWTADNVHV